MSYERDENQNRTPWVEVKRFEEGGVIAQVSRMDHPRRPRYSYAIYRMNRDGKPSRFMPVMAFGEGKIEVAPITERLAKVVQQVEDYVRAELQAHEDEWIANAERRERAQIDRDKPKMRRGIGAPGKTDRDREKKRHGKSHADGV